MECKARDIRMELKGLKGLSEEEKQFVLQRRVNLFQSEGKNKAGKTAGEKSLDAFNAKVESIKRYQKAFGLYCAKKASDSMCTNKLMLTTYGPDAKLPTYKPPATKPPATTPPNAT